MAKGLSLLIMREPAGAQLSNYPRGGSIFGELSPTYRHMCCGSRSLGNLVSLVLDHTLCACGTLAKFLELLSY